MFKAIIEASVRFRWFIVLATTLVAAWGLFQLTKLPIDAVPDITNRQVQINTVAPALAPEQMERQVTYPLETAMAGHSGNPEHPLPEPQRLQPGDGHLQRRHRHLFRPPAGGRAHGPGARKPARGRRTGPVARSPPAWAKS
jgi:hypothetical protein